MGLILRHLAHRTAGTIDFLRRCDRLFVQQQNTEVRQQKRLVADLPLEQ
jgi:hypothetical protein